MTMSGKLQLNNSAGYALVLALLPVLVMYRVPVLNIGITTLLIAVGAIYAMGVIALNRKKSDRAVTLLLALCVLFFCFKSSRKTTFQYLLSLLNLLAIAKGAANKKKLIKYIETVSVIASVCLLLQVLIHAVFSFHIPFINANLLLDMESNQDYAYWVTTGYNGIESIYRPSAFFLEPSHFSEYCIYGLGFSLFADNRSYGKSALITAGILLTTSGLGMAMTVCIWAYWFIYKNETRSLGYKIYRLMIALVLMGAIIIVLYNVPFFQTVVSRFTNNSTTGYNAINGRLFWWNRYLTNLSGRNLIFGFGENNLPGVYFTGFMVTLYAYGILGCALLFGFLIIVFIKGDKLTRLFCLTYFGLFFAASLISFIGLLFNVGVILALYNESPKKTGSYRMIMAEVPHNETKAI